MQEAKRQDKNGISYIYMAELELFEYLESWLVTRCMVINNAHCVIHNNNMEEKRLAATEPAQSSVERFLLVTCIQNSGLCIRHAKEGKLYIAFNCTVEP